MTSALQLRIEIAELTLHNNRPVGFTQMPTGKDDENWENGINDLVLLFRWVISELIPRKTSKLTPELPARDTMTFSNEIRETDTLTEIMGQL